MSKKQLEIFLLEKELNKRKYESSLAEFTKRAWSVLEPGTELKWNWHHDLLCEYLELSLLGDVKRLIINIPPRSMKSILVSVCFPAWCWVNEPSLRFLCGSYSQSLSSKHSVDCRALIESDWFKFYWSDKISLSNDQNMKTEFMNNKRGHRIATSILGTATGKGGDFLLCDDAHDTTSAASNVERVKTVETFRQKFVTRLDDKKTGRIIVVMQRLHQADLTGELLKDPGWTHLCLPAISEQTTTYIYPKSKKEKIYEVGEILHFSREDIAVLNKLKIEMGTRAFTGQYQQRPAALEGNIIKRPWLKFYDTHPEIRSFDQVIQSWDLTFTGKSTSDYVVGQVWGAKGPDRYLLDQERGQYGMTETLQAIQMMTKKWPQSSIKVIEAKANGPAVEDVLRRTMQGIVLWEPQGDKVSRCNAIAPIFESGHVYLPNASKYFWVQDAIEEMCTFPNGAHDDVVDSMTMALLRLNEHGKAGGLRVIFR